MRALPKPCICLLAVVSLASYSGEAGEPDTQATGPSPAPSRVPEKDREEPPEAKPSEGAQGQPGKNPATAAKDGEKRKPEGGGEEQKPIEIVVTATRGEVPVFDSPASVEVISSHDIEGRRLSRTVPEAFRETPGVMVQKTAQGQGSPYIRGFTGFRTLFLIDGIRLNNSVFRDGPNEYWNTVDPFSIERLELVRGPSSVLYGSDAVGGTVNAITKSRHDYRDGFGVNGGVHYRFSEAEDSHQGRVELEGSSGKDVGFLIGISPKTFGDVRAADIGRQGKTGYDELDGDAKVDWFPGLGHHLTFAYQRSALDDVWRTHKTIHGISWRGSAIGDERERVLDYGRQLGYVKYQAEFPGSPVEKLNTTVSWQALEETMDRVRGDGRSEHQGFEVNTLGFSTQLESSTPIGHLTYGLEYYRDWVTSFRKNFNADGTFASRSLQGPIADDASYDLLGVYVQDQIKLLDDRLELIPGVRYTLAAVSAGEVQDPETGGETSLENDWNGVVGSLRFLGRLDGQRHWNLFGGVSQGFRSPNLSDMTRLDTARSKEIETVSPGLKPEKYIAYELGVRTQYEKVSAQAAYYYTDIDDMIVRVPTGVTVGTNFEVHKVNAGDGFVHGVEIEAKWRFHPRLTVSGGFSWAEGRVDTFPTAAPVKDRRAMDRMMPAMAFAGLRWDRADRRIWAEAILTAAGSQTHLSPADAQDTQRIPPGGTPGYAVVTLRGGATLHKGLNLTISIENVADKDYRVHGSGLNEPGFNAIAALHWRF